MNMNDGSMSGAWPLESWVNGGDAGNRALRVIERCAEPTGRVTDGVGHLTGMVGALREVFELEPLPEDELRQAVATQAKALAADFGSALSAPGDRRLARGAMLALTWRVGLLFAMAYANGQSRTAAKMACSTRLMREVVRRSEAGDCVAPDRDVALKLIGYARDMKPGALEAGARELLKRLGLKVENPVRRYGHPIDSGLVRALDTELLNGAFRRFVDFNADSTMGQIVASSIPVTKENYPALNRIVDECVQTLGIRRPYVVVTSHMGGINAMTFGSDEEPYIAVTSLLTRVMTEAQMRFVIGHECGHIAMGHMVYHTAASVLGAFSQFIPVVGKVVYSTISYPLNAWARRSEITADRAGLHCCGDPEVAKKTLLQLETAFNSADEVDMRAYLESSRRYLSKGLVRKLGEYGSNHPMTPKRIEAIDLFSRSTLYYDMMGLPTPPDAIGEAELARQTERIISVL